MQTFPFSLPTVYTPEYLLLPMLIQPSSPPKFDKFFPVGGNFLQLFFLEPLVASLIPSQCLHPSGLDVSNTPKTLPWKFDHCHRDLQG